MVLDELDVQYLATHGHVILKPEPGEQPPYPYSIRARVQSAAPIPHAVFYGRETLNIEVVDRGAAPKRDLGRTAIARLHARRAREQTS